MADPFFQRFEPKDWSSLLTPLFPSNPTSNLFAKSSRSTCKIISNTELLLSTSTGTTLVSAASTSQLDLLQHLLSVASLVSFQRNTAAQGSLFSSKPSSLPISLGAQIKVLQWPDLCPLSLTISPTLSHLLTEFQPLWPPCHASSGQTWSCLRAFALAAPSLQHSPGICKACSSFCPNVTFSVRFYLISWYYIATSDASRLASCSCVAKISTWHIAHLLALCLLSFFLHWNVCSMRLETLLYSRCLEQRLAYKEQSSNCCINLKKATNGQKNPYLEFRPPCSHKQVMWNSALRMSVAALPIPWAHCEASVNVRNTKTSKARGWKYKVNRRRRALYPGKGTSGFLSSFFHS